jgi:hypothetical protein
MKRAEALDGVASPLEVSLMGPVSFHRAFIPAARIEHVSRRSMGYGLDCQNQAASSATRKLGPGNRSAPFRPHPAAAIGSIRLGSLFLTLPTRGRTGQHVISPDG